MIAGCLDPRWHVGAYKASIGTARQVTVTTVVATSRTLGNTKYFLTIIKFVEVG